MTPNREIVERLKAAVDSFRELGVEPREVEVTEEVYEAIRSSVPLTAPAIGLEPMFEGMYLTVTKHNGAALPQYMDDLVLRGHVGEILRDIGHKHGLPRA